MQSKSVLRDFLTWFPISVPAAGITTYSWRTPSVHSHQYRVASSQQRAGGCLDSEWCGDYPTHSAPCLPFLLSTQRGRLKHGVKKPVSIWMNTSRGSNSHSGQAGLPIRFPHLQLKAAGRGSSWPAKHDTGTEQDTADSSHQPLQADTSWSTLPGRGPRGGNPGLSLGRCSRTRGGWDWASGLVSTLG